MSPKPPGRLVASVEPHTSGTGLTEHMIWLRLPSAGGDGALIGVTESKEAATAIAGLFQRIIDCEKGWQKVISPDGHPLRW